MFPPEVREKLEKQPDSEKKAVGLLSWKLWYLLLFTKRRYLVLEV